jgi:hypothetical protein
MEEILRYWNPWWIAEEKINKLAKIERNSYLGKISPVLNRKEVIAISGVRRSGKSTIIYQLIKVLLDKVNPENVLYLNFDDERLVNELDSPELLEKIYKEFLSIHGVDGKTYLFLDEIQNVPNWEKWIKRMYDSDKNVKFVISGSSSALLSSEFSTLLTGRNITFDVYPLSYKEFSEFRGTDIPEKIEYHKLSEKEHNYLNMLDKYAFFGGFPAITFEDNKTERQLVLQQYFRDIIFRDIVKRYKIKNSKRLEKLAVYVMENIATLLSYRKISKILNSSVDTVNEHLTHLENSYLLFQLQDFSYSKKEFLRENKPKKIYSIDPGLRNAVSIKEDKGRVIENIIFTHLKRHFKWVSYWREVKEVDFVLEKEKIAIQVCSDEISETEENDLREFIVRFKFKRGLILSRSKYDVSDDKIKYVPIWIFLLNENTELSW